MNEAEKNLAAQLFAVFEKLRDEDFANSRTSEILKTESAEFFESRAREEFAELAGVVDGSHRHSDDFEKDFLLESSQVFYWLALAAVVAKKSFSEFLENSKSEIEKLAKIHAANKIPFVKIFEKDLAECREKNYL